MNKLCPKCELSKLTSDFYKDKRTPSGLCSLCKSCHNLIVATWRAKNPNKQNEYTLKSDKKNRPKRTAKKRRRDARKLHATPTWLTTEHNRAIEACYRDAAARTALYRVSYQVDHIVPLQGTSVCGLHVP